MTHGTIEETYEHHLVRIVKILFMDFESDGVETGEDLEKFLRKNSHHLADALLYDIETWMGFDDLLEQVKND